MTFVGYLDLISTRWNVEDDILLSGGDCDAPKEGRFSFLHISLLDEWRSATVELGKEEKILQKGKGRNPVGYLAGLPWSFEKNEFQHCLESGQESGRKSGQIPAGF